MTCDDIRISAQLLTGMKIDDITSLRWVVEAMKTIMRQHPLAAPKKTVSVTVAEGDSYDIAEELIRIEVVRPAGSQKAIPGTQYTCDELGNMIFRCAGNFDITYRYLPSMPTNKADNVVVPDIYANAIQYYIASKIRGRVFGQNDGDSSWHGMKYETELSNADIAMASANRRHRRMPVRY